jgi:transposase
MQMLAIPGANIVGVQFTPTGIVLDLRRRGRRLHCPCGWSTRAGRLGRLDEQLL